MMLFLSVNQQQLRDGYVRLIRLRGPASRSASASSSSSTSPLASIVESLKPDEDYARRRRVRKKESQGSRKGIGRRGRAGPPLLPRSLVSIVAALRPDEASARKRCCADRRRGMEGSNGGEGKFGSRGGLVLVLFGLLLFCALFFHLRFSSHVVLGAFSYSLSLCVSQYNLWEYGNVDSDEEEELSKQMNKAAAARGRRR